MGSSIFSECCFSYLHVLEDVLLDSTKSHSREGDRLGSPGRGSSTSIKSDLRAGALVRVHVLFIDSKSVISL